MKGNTFRFAAALVFLLIVLHPSPIMPAERVLTGFVIRDIPEGEELSYRVTFVDQEEKSFAIDGDLAILQGFSYRTERLREDGRDYLVVTEIEQLGQNMHNKFETVFELEDYLIMRRYTESVYSHSGKMIRQQFADYEDPVYSDVPPLTITTHVITYWLRGVDFEPGKSAEFYLRLLGDSSQPWRMHARVGEEIEQVTVPAGTFECYRVIIDPDYKHFLGKWAWASIIIKPLVPDFFIWYSVEPPHPMVRFEGALGVKGITAVQIHELVSMGPDAE